ncbi:hypothetical protein [Niabella aurantiaca]|uniref:hypothetical protein n=1 Tax=Niabella aurantiaca TaxID=379900 RepID=UPI000370607B|nr:hypothetical protein [Niabella aurantiaca]
MRNEKLLLAVLVFITVAACSKTEKTSNETDVVDNTAKPDSNIVKQGIVAAVGSWQLSETRISPGILVDWGRVNNGPVLTFKDTSSYEINGDMSLFWPTTSKNGTTGLASRFRSKVIYLLPANSRDTAFFGLRISKDTLELAGVSCVEGCGYRFRKVE